MRSRSSSRRRSRRSSTTATTRGFPHSRHCRLRARTRSSLAANDGMVHVFDVNDGHEVFAYVPSSLLRAAGAPDFAVDASGKPTGLQALTFQDGGVPIYKHHFYVDSSPRTADIDFNSAGVKGGALRLAHDRRRRHGQGRRQLLRARSDRPRRGKRIGCRSEAPVGVPRSGLEIHLRPAGDREDLRLRLDGHRDFRLQQCLRRGPDLLPRPRDGEALRGEAVYEHRRDLLHRARWLPADERSRADQRVHQGLPQPVRRAGLRRRSLRKLLAVRRQRSGSGEMDGQQVRDPGRRGQPAAGHDRPADRDRPQQRRRPLRLHRNGAAARPLRPDPAVPGAAADDVRDPRRLVDQAAARCEPADRARGS